MENLEKNRIEEIIRNKFYWDIHPLFVSYYEEDYKAKKDVKLSQLEKALKNEQKSLEAYYKMSVKARHYGLWKNQGKMSRKKIKVLKELIKLKKKVLKCKV